MLDTLHNLTTTPPEVGLSLEGLDLVAPMVQSFIDKQALSGAVTMVARRGKVAHLQAFGMMNLQARTPMGPDTIFRIYSMTKPLAAVGVMILFEDGKLELDAPASTYISSNSAA